MKAFPINNKINEYDQDPSLPEGKNGLLEVSHPIIGLWTKNDLTGALLTA